MEDIGRWRRCKKREEKESLPGTRAYGKRSPSFSIQAEENKSDTSKEAAFSIILP
jgi:hypothetical protein